MRKIVSLLLFLVPLVAHAEDSAIRLIDFSGRSVNFSDVQRDATIVAFWMAACVPCIEEMALLEALNKKSAGDSHIAVIGVNLDDNEDLPTAKKILSEQKVTYRMLRDPRKALVKKWFPEHPDELGLPTVLVLDRSFHAIYSQGFQPGKSVDAFIAEWEPHLAAARAGQLREHLRRIESTKAGSIDPAQKEQMIEKILRSKHPDLPDAEIKKRLETTMKEFKKTGHVSIN